MLFIYTKTTLFFVDQLFSGEYLEVIFIHLTMQFRLDSHCLRI